MTKGKLIDEHVSVHQCKLAVNALLGHALKVEEKKSENQLLSGKEQNVWLVVTQKQMHPEKKLKPAKIPLAHPIVDPRTSPVCLITKDPQREYKDLLESHNIKFISRVVGIAKLKGKFKPFEARRMLLKENGLFLADERVIPLLPGLLGKKFFEAKKQPIPVCLTRKDLKGELERAISSTYFHQNQGTCTSIKIGILSQKPAQVLANLEMALPVVVKRVNGEWDNVQSLHIKTNSSASLPIWSCNLGEAEGARWDGLAAGASSDEESAAKSSEDSEMEVDEKPQPAKGKKRAAQDDEEKPKKKAKAESTAAGEAEPPIKPEAKFEATIKEPVPSKAKAIVSAAADVLAKRLKKRKTTAADAEGAGLEAPSSPSVSIVPVVSTELPTDERSKKSRRKPRTTTGNAPVPTPATAPEPSPPATPSVSSHKQARASAVDSFEDSEAHPAPVPPNTPANALATQTPKLSKRTKNVNTPVSAAIAKLAAAPEPVVSTVEQTDVPAAGTGTNGLTTRVKKPRHKKQKAAIVSAADDESVPAPKEPIPEPSAEAAEGVPAAKKTKRKKQKSSNDDVPPVDATSAKEPAAEPVVEAAEAAPETKKVKRRKQKAAEPLREEATAPAASADGADGSTLTKEEFKQKRSSSRVEKKKDKLVNSKPASKSAKDAVVGKRKL